MRMVRMLWLVVVALVLLASTAAADGTFLYELDPVSLSNGHQVSSGFVLLDIDSGPVSVDNILDFEIVVAGPAPHMVSAANGIAATYCMSATPHSLELDAGCGSLANAVLYFDSFLNNLPRCSSCAQRVRWENEPGNGLSRRASVLYSNLDADSDPLVFGSTGYPLLSTFVIGVPEPSGSLLAITAVASLLTISAHGIVRSWMQAWRQAA